MQRYRLVAVATTFLLTGTVTSASDNPAMKDYPQVYDMSSCSAYYSFRAGIADDEIEAKAFRSAEVRVFQRISKILGSGTAVQMTRSSLNSWRLVGMQVTSDSAWERLFRMLDTRCLAYQ